MLKDNLAFILHYGVLLFWALYWTIVVLTDIFDFMQKKGLLSSKWMFSNNYVLLNNIFFRYKILGKSFFVDFSYSIIILIVFIIASLYWVALFTKNNPLQLDYATIAFAASFTLDALFILFDEIVIEYDLAHRHMVRATFRMATYLLYRI